MIPINTLPFSQSSHMVQKSAPKMEFQWVLADFQTKNGKNQILRQSNHCFDSEQAARRSARYFQKHWHVPDMYGTELVIKKQQNIDQHEIKERF